jgi:hypothetical protein
LKNIISNNAYFFLLLITVAIITLIVPGENSDPLPLFSSFTIVFIASIGIVFRSEMVYSLAKIFNLFTYLFLGIVPIITYKFNISYWGAKAFSSVDYILTNIVILIALIAFNITYGILTNRRLIDANKNPITIDISGSPGGRGKALFLVSLSCAISYYIYYRNGFDVLNVWTRGKLGDTSVLVESSQIEYLIVSYFVTPMLSINLVLYRLWNLRSRLVGSILLILLILSAPPTSMARFAAAAMYIPILIVYIPYFSMRNFLSFFIIISLYFVFPTLDKFRQELPTSWSDLINVSDNINMVYSGHFDAYQSLMMALNEDFVTYGYQLISALLFFIPRAFWPDKGVGSGQEMAERYNLTFDNISATYLAEGYINFGLLGVLSFVLILAYFCAYMDKRYWVGGRATDILGLRTFYFYSLPLLFFVLRGDLMSSFAYFCGFGAAVVLVSVVSRLRFVF